MFATVIVGAEVIAATGRARRTICISAGKIAALLDPAEPVTAGETIEAHGQIVLPGLVDSHVHFREPGLTHKEDFSTGTLAAAAGGVTTVMVMPTDLPMTATAQTFTEKKALADGRCFTDYALQAAVGTDVSHVPALAELGAISFELFMADLPPPFVLDATQDIIRALTAIERVQGVAGISPGDDSIVKALSAEEMARATDPLSFARSRPPVAEAVGLARACLAVAQTGAQAHIRQVSCRASVEVLRALAPAWLSSEVTPHNLVLDERELLKHGPVAKVAPPLRTAENVAAVREALRTGVIRMVATDHAPHTIAEKQAGANDIWKAPGGFPGVQTFLPLMLKLVGDGVLTYEDVVRTCCEAPARTFGIFPKKGCLQKGSDADIVIVDPNRPLTISSKDQQSKAKLTPFEGMIAPARPVRALLRGRTIMLDGSPTGTPSGQFLRPGSS